MRKIKKKSNTATQPFFSRSKLLVAGIAVAAILLVLFIFIFIEGNTGKLTIKNDTDIKLEYVKPYFVYSEDTVSDSVVAYEEIKPGSSVYEEAQKIDLLGLEANLEVRFKFEGYDELFVDAGYFNDNFYGDIGIIFDQKDDGTILLKVKAKNSVLPSSTIICNDEFNIDLTEGYVD